MEILKQYSEFMNTIKRCLSNNTDLTPIQALLLIQLKDQPLIRAADLKTYNMYTGSNPSYTLDKLKILDYIERIKNPQDKREYGITLTEKGKLFVEEFEKKYHDIF